MFKFLKGLFYITDANDKVKKGDFFNSTPIQGIETNCNLNKEKEILTKEDIPSIRKRNDDNESLKKQDTVIIQVLTSDSIMFFNIVLPLFYGVKNSWINKEEKITLIRDAYCLYSNNMESLEKLYCKIDELDSTKEKQLISQYIKGQKAKEPNISEYWLSGKIKTNMLPLFEQITSRNFLFSDSLDLMNKQINRDIIKNPQGSIEIPQWKWDFLTSELKDFYAIVESLYKYQFKMVFFKIFIYIEMLKSIQKEEELSTIINNAIIKYRQSNIIAEKIYDIFISYMPIAQEFFTQEDFEDLLNVVVFLNDKSIQLFENDKRIISVNLQGMSIAEAVDKIIEEKIYQNYDLEWVLKFILREKSIEKGDLEFFIAETYQLPFYIKKVQASALKEELLKTSEEKSISIVDIDLMSGVQFEEFLCEYFNGQGYQCSTTKASGDQGIDLIVKKGELTIAIQAKCYSGTVGNHAVMEAVAGMKYYSANRCMVITNSTFSKSAIELAKANGVILLDRQVLTEKLNEV